MAAAPAAPPRRVIICGITASDREAASFNFTDEGGCAVDVENYDDFAAQMDRATCGRVLVSTLTRPLSLIADVLGVIVRIFDADGITPSQEQIVRLSHLCTSVLAKVPASRACIASRCIHESTSSCREFQLVSGVLAVIADSIRRESCSRAGSSSTEVAVAESQNFDHLAGEFERIRTTGTLPVVMMPAGTPKVFSIRLRGNGEGIELRDQAGTIRGVAFARGETHYDLLACHFLRRAETSLPRRTLCFIPAPELRVLLLRLSFLYSIVAVVNLRPITDHPTADTELAAVRPHYAHLCADRHGTPHVETAQNGVVPLLALLYHTPDRQPDKCAEICAELIRECKHSK